LNYLAHIFLSGDNDLLKIGNFLGDFVRSKDQKNYHPQIQKGINLHRYIDHYTDTHAIVKKSKIRLRPKFGHYAPVIVDMYYDHFLALNWSKYAKVELEDFTYHFYNLTEKNKSILPEKAHHILYYMKRDNWLYEYRTLKGIGKALIGMSRRTKFVSKMESAIFELEENFSEYQKDFNCFFPKLRAGINNYITTQL
tara:strand:+ start:2996 stop:3583 length:588 start_codon:yes stop_codon:yes gene_type:complete